MLRTILALSLAIGGICSIAFLGCGETCTAGSTRCADGNTLATCANLAGVIGPQAGGNYWDNVPCNVVNPVCVVLSSGGATCASAPEPSCTPDAGWFCNGNAPAFCNQGFLQNATSTIAPPPGVCGVDGGLEGDASAAGEGGAEGGGPSPEAGADAAPDAPSGVPSDAGEAGSDAGDATTG